MNKEFRLVQAGVVTPDEQMYQIAGIPEHHTGTKGLYISTEPYKAAQKAVTGIFKHMKTYSDWYPEEWLSNDALELVLVLVGPSGNLYAYKGWRQPAPQGKRTVGGDRGRWRSHKWVPKTRRLDFDSLRQGKIKVRHLEGFTSERNQDSKLL
jgi:hypothetical protein